MKARPVLVIGGTGTLGHALVPILLRDPFVSRVRVMSRGEHRQTEMSRTLRSERTDFFVGDVRDYHRVYDALEDCESVWNLAAMKSVDKAEYDSGECHEITVGGCKNVIRAARERKVSRAIFTSTDKAASPLNCYGISKALAERLWIQGNVGATDTRYSALRYGNVLASQGSVIECWRRHRESGPIVVTDAKHTRFFITPENAALFVYQRWQEMEGGEVFIPKMKSTSLQGLLDAFRTSADTFVEVGARPGEKTHEILFSDDEAPFVTDCGDYFIRWPYSDWFPVQRRGSPVKRAYSSKNADRFTKAELKKMLEGVTNGTHCG